MAVQQRASASTQSPSSKAPDPKLRLKEFAQTDDKALGTLPPDIGLKVGSKLPDIALNTPDGGTARLHTLNEKSALMLVFYRGGWCPFCNFQIRSLTEAYKEFEKRGVLPIAISVDQPNRAQDTQASYDIPFPVLSDPELKAHSAFNVVNSIDEQTYERLKSRGMDLEAYSGKGHHKVAVPSIFIVDNTGAVVWAHADADYKVRPKTPQLLAVIEELKLRRVD